MTMPQDPQSSRRTPARSIAMILVSAAVFAGAITAGQWFRNGSESSPDATNQSADASPASGRLLYKSYCSNCHGPEGHCDPDAMERLTPPPRDFTGSNWRFPRTAESIETVIRNGIAGTAMPAGGSQFNEEQIAELRDFVLLLADQNAGESTNVSEPDSWSAVGFSPFSLPRSAPRLSVERTDGTEVELTDFTGNVVLINFWGTTCAHCLSEMPDLQHLAEEFADEGLVVLSVCADESDATLVTETAFAFAPGLDVFVDSTGLATQRYDVQAMPTFWLIDRDGQALARRTGAVDWSSPAVRSLIVELLGAD